MTTKSTTAGLLCVTLLASAAAAQTQPQSPSQNPLPGNQQPLGSTDAPRNNTGLITQPTPGALRVSDLLGQNVMDANNKDIGEIEDVILDRNGQVAAFIINLDEGALGMDDREVAVPAHAIQVDPHDQTATTGNIQHSGPNRRAVEGQQVVNQGGVPGKLLAAQRIVLTIPVDQLRSAPAFDEDGDD
jgi:sporulation protein YlmC with PRC-barrel domain